LATGHLASNFFGYRQDSGAFMFKHVLNDCEVKTLFATEVVRNGRLIDPGSLCELSSSGSLQIERAENLQAGFDQALFGI